ncbi:hypothetical protein D3C75_1331230 [compost metagenome]
MLASGTNGLHHLGQSNAPLVVATFEGRLNRLPCVLTITAKLDFSIEKVRVRYTKRASGTIDFDTWQIRSSADIKACNYS